MASSEDDRSIHGETSDGEPSNRRSRLWLGYSADNLRSDSTGYRADEQSHHSRPSSVQGNRRHESHENYTVSDDYDNFDELAAPFPVAGSRKEQKHRSLEERNTSRTSQGAFNDFENLDEVAAPPPLEDPLKEREEGYLEDRHGTSDFVRLKAAADGFEEHEDNEARQPEHGGDRSPSEEESQHEKRPPSLQRQNVSKLATEVYTISHLIFFSILGTLARLGLQALTFYPGAPVQTGLLWANVGGSLILGFLSEDRKLFQEEWGSQPKHKDQDDREKGRPLNRSPSAKQRHASVKKTLPLYIGLAIGFCGSFTSFSSFTRDAFFALSNALPVPIQHPSSSPISQTINVHRNPGYSFLAVLAVLIITIGLSLMALQFGAHLALFLEPYTPSIPFLFARKIVDRSVVFLACGCWLAAILMAIWPPDRPGGPIGDASWARETWRSQALFALVFAPVGCLLRFYTSILLNGKIKTFPLGTFAVNIFGTAMEAMFVNLERVPAGGMVGCQVLQGLADGFCGCLTTVSTWVAELTALRLKHAYFYGAMSVGVALSLFVVITGSFQWTRGFATPLCMS